MGAARDDEDPHAGRRFVPKIIVAGRLAGTVDGRPVVIDADGAGLKIAFTAFRTAWATRGSVKALLPVLGVCRRADVPVRVTIAGFLTLEILPNPSGLARIVVPGLASFP